MANRITASVANWANATSWRGTVGIEPNEILTLAMKAAGGAGLTMKESRYDYFKADAAKSPGKVLLGGLAYYLAAKTGQIQVRINKTASSGYVVSIEARGQSGQRALSLLAASLAQSAPILTA